MLRVSVESLPPELIACAAHHTEFSGLNSYRFQRVCLHFKHIHTYTTEPRGQRATRTSGAGMEMLLHWYGIEKSKLNKDSGLVR